MKLKKHPVFQIYKMFTLYVYIYGLWFDSLWPSLTYWSTLVQVMACHLFGAKPFPEPILINYFPGNIFKKFYLKFKNFLLKNALGNVVCKKSAILFKPQWASWMFWYWMKDCILFYHKSSFLSGFLPLPVSHDAMCHRVKHAGIVCVGRCSLKVEFNCTWAAFWNIEIPDKVQLIFPFILIFWRCCIGGKYFKPRTTRKYLQMVGISLGSL